MHPALITRSTYPRRWAIALLVALCCTAGALPARAASTPVRAQVAQRACHAMTHKVGAASGPPIFLASYPADTRPDAAPLKTAAFTYDNALAVIALIACGRLPQAERIGAALRMAATADPRLLNAYRAGPVSGKPLPNGWWDPQAKRWLEDAQQCGTATGNVAWAGLALMALYAATGDARWRDAASHLGRWIIRNTADAPGYRGGFDGFDPHATRLQWKSTEHNIDAVALFAWLARDAHGDTWRSAARSARTFVASQWDATDGYFRIGTLPDGKENTGASALDVQLWSQLLPSVPTTWHRAVGYAAVHFGVTGGFAFSGNRDGVWLEGTAQAALVYATLGDAARAGTLFATIAGEFAPGGYVFATRAARIRTGLALGPNSRRADFYYYRQPHLGATAWAALAALGWNPFVAHPKR